MSQAFLTPGDALIKAQKYCAYQERCKQDVRHRFLSWGLPKDKWSAVIEKLEEYGFIDEERFATCYVRGKTSVKKWGRNKIRFELKKRQIPDVLIERSINQIDESNYCAILQDLAEKYMDKLSSQDTFVQRRKLYAYLSSKGYESGLIRDVSDRLIK
jgi:regulatory protein